MRRIGLVGTESSHVEHFIRLLNVEGRHPGCRAVALADGDPARNAELAARGGIDTIVDRAEALVGLVDAVIVSHRDGALHREVAEPLLRAGLAVFVDKPLAASTDDAKALIEAGRADGASLHSASALRFVPEIARWRAAAAEYGPLRHLHVVGPADPASEHSGLFFYGIHLVEAALEMLGNPVVEPGSLDVDVVRVEGVIVARFVLDGVCVTLSFVTPGEGGRPPFHATAVHDKGVFASELVLDADYIAPVLDAFLHDTLRLTEAKLLTPVAIMEAIVAAL